MVVVGRKERRKMATLAIERMEDACEVVNCQ